MRLQIKLRLFIPIPQAVAQVVQVELGQVAVIPQEVAAAIIIMMEHT